MRTWKLFVTGCIISYGMFTLGRVYDKLIPNKKEMADNNKKKTEEILRRFDFAAVHRYLMEEGVGIQTSRGYTKNFTVEDVRALGKSLLDEVSQVSGREEEYMEFTATNKDGKLTLSFTIDEITL